LQNDSYSLSIVKKLTAGKERWTITKTDGDPTDIGVVLEDAEKLTLKSDISTVKPLKIVTPDETQVVFEIMRRKKKGPVNRDLAFIGFILCTPIMMAVWLISPSGWNENWIFAATVLLLAILYRTVHSRKTLYDVTDGAGTHIGVISTGISATFTIETQSGRWQLTESSSLVKTFIRGNGVRLALLDESGAQVGHVHGIRDGLQRGGRDIQVQDSRLGPRVAAAAGFFTTSLFQSDDKYHRSGHGGSGLVRDLQEYIPND
jgi:hypothetical protein